MSTHCLRQHQHTSNIMNVYLAIYQCCRTLIKLPYAFPATYMASFIHYHKHKISRTLYYLFLLLQAFREHRISGPAHPQAYTHITIKCTYNSLKENTIKFISW